MLLACCVAVHVVFQGPGFKKRDIVHRHCCHNSIISWMRNDVALRKLGKTRLGGEGGGIVFWALASVEPNPAG